MENIDLIVLRFYKGEELILLACVGGDRRRENTKCALNKKGLKSKENTRIKTRFPQINGTYSFFYFSFNHFKYFIGVRVA